MFNVISPINPCIKYTSDILNEQYTEHIKKDRLWRIEKIANLDNCKVDRCFLVDKGHKNGLEIHAVFNNGVIAIFNEKSKKLITLYMGRKGQIIRLYKQCGLWVNSDIIRSANKYRGLTEEYNNIKIK